MCNCHHHCHCGCNYFGNCNCHHWYQPQIVYYPPPATYVVQAPPVEKKIDRILELAERQEQRAKLNKKKSARW